MTKNKDAMKLRFDFNNMMSDFVGSEQGFTDEDLTKNAAFAKTAFDKFAAIRGTGMTGWADLPYNQDEICDDIIKTANDIRDKFDYFVVLGIGGSALGPIAAFQALCHLHYNDLSKEKRNGPKFYVEDNIDPERMQALLDVIDVEKTMFNVITKSGATSETMTQYLIIMDILTEKLGNKASEHMIATTSAQKGNLIKIAKEKPVNLISRSL